MLATQLDTRTWMLQEHSCTRTWMPTQLYKNMDANTAVQEHGCQHSCTRTWMPTQLYKNMDANTAVQEHGCQHSCTRTWMPTQLYKNMDANTYCSYDDRLEFVIRTEIGNISEPAQEQQYIMISTTINTSNKYQ